jgi:hypothetical protein
MTVSWALEAQPYMQYNGSNSAGIVDWLENLAVGPYWHAWTSNQTVSITSEGGGELELHLHCGSGGGGSGDEWETDLTLNTGDWVSGMAVIVTDARFTERYMVR